MRFLVSEKLGPHKYKTPEGYLVCTDAILSRTGKQEYLRSELFGDSCENSDEHVQVDRIVDEVFSDKAMASFENKAICMDHPDVNVNAENHNELSVGFVRDIRKAKHNNVDVMMGTLVITDKRAIEAVESGEYTELSCGYDCDITDENSPQQRNIRGNHVALCKQGRAGIARIIDSHFVDMTRSTEKMVEQEYNKLISERNKIDAEIDRNDNNARYDLARASDKLQKLNKEILSMKKRFPFLTDSTTDADNYTFKLAKKKNDYDEYVVRAFKNGKYHEDASYYTDDWDDAVGTLKDMAKRQNLTVTQTGTTFVADSTKIELCDVAIEVRDGSPVRINRVAYTQGEFSVLEADSTHGKLFVVVKNYKGENPYTGGGTVEFSLANAKRIANDYVVMANLKKKYGEKEGYKRWMSGQKDSMFEEDVELNIDWSDLVERGKPIDRLSLIKNVVQKYNISIDAARKAVENAIDNGKLGHNSSGVWLLDSIDDAVKTHFELGYIDGKRGVFDKWYQYNAKDNGKEYQRGIDKAKDEGYEIIKIIEGSGTKSNYADDAKLITDEDWVASFKTPDGTYWTDIFEAYDKNRATEHAEDLAKKRGFKFVALSTAREHFARKKDAKAKDAIDNSNLKSFEVEYVKDGIIHICAVKAKSLQDAIAKARK